MHETALRPHAFGQPGQEGDDVVPGLALDLIDPFNIGRADGGQRRIAALADHRGSFGGYRADSAIASQARASISNQIRYRFSGDQIAAACGRE